MTNLAILTPGHFLIGDPLLAPPEVPIDASASISMYATNDSRFLEAMDFRLVVTLAVASKMEQRTPKFSNEWRKSDHNFCQMRLELCQISRETRWSISTCLNVGCTPRNPTSNWKTIFFCCLSKSVLKKWVFGPCCSPSAVNTSFEIHLNKIAAISPKS